MNEKQVYENQETAIQLLKENVELKTRNSILKTRIINALEIINKNDNTIFYATREKLKEILNGEDLWK